MKLGFVFLLFAKENCSRFVLPCYHPLSLPPIRSPLLPTTVLSCHAQCQCLPLACIIRSYVTLKTARTLATWHTSQQQREQRDMPKQMPANSVGLFFMSGS